MSDLDKLHDVCNKTYKEQAVWFLNCFWEDFAEKEAELIWQYVETNAKLDLENHEEGSSLDEMKAHVFLEKFDETLTVREMRAKLRSTGAIGESERPKTVPLTHYLLYKYNADWRLLVDETRQGDNAEEIEKAEKMLAEVTELFKQSEARAAEARTALNAAVSAENQAKAREAEAVARENDAVARETEAKESEAQAVSRENEAVQRETEAKASEKAAQARDTEAKASHAKSQETEAKSKVDAAAAVEREGEAKAAQSELEEALAALKAEEDAFNKKKADLEKKSQEGGVVSRNKAANELAQLLAEDPLPLRRAKITAEAAVKRAEKTSKAAASAREAAETSAKAASAARVEAEKDAKEAAAARVTAENDAAAASKAREAAASAREAATQARQAAEKARQAASAAREEANKQREAAEKARQDSERAKEAAEKALNDASAKLNEAEAYLEEVKSKPGCSFGAIWWIDRELHEQKKYLPVSKGGIAK